MKGKHRELWQDFSIVIPAHNEENYLPKTLDSVLQAFEAIGKHGEVIVVNDASTDTTRDVALSRQVRVVDVELRNIGAVRNAGAQASTNPWLFFLDADTCLPGKTLSSALDQLAMGAAGGGAAVEMSTTRPISMFKWFIFYTIKILWQTLGGWAAGCFMYCRRDVFEQFGGFEEQYYAAEELFFSKAVKRSGKFALLREPVLTSARKMEAYSTLELMRFVTLPILRPATLFKTRFGLELLYDDEKSR